MRRKLTSYTAASIALALLTLAAPPHPAAAQAQGQTTVRGHGGALLTDTATGINYPVLFGISAVVRADGSANGHINFVFPQPFAGVWGAVPGVDLIHIAGRVTSGEVLGDGTVVLQGTLTERDYTNGKGLVFLEENVPFRIEVGGSSGPQTMRLQWCLLPVFPITVTDGDLTVN